MREHRLVSIAKNKKDARARDIRLTKDGSKKLAQAQKLLKQHQEDLFKLLSARDSKAFSKAIDNLLKALRPQA
jgi:DNA-binding MarR family transcriptional regulator